MTNHQIIDRLRRGVCPLCDNNDHADTYVGTVAVDHENDRAFIVILPHFCRHCRTEWQTYHNIGEVPHFAQVRHTKYDLNPLPSVDEAARVERRLQPVRR